MRSPRFASWTLAGTLCLGGCLNMNPLRGKDAPSDAATDAPALDAAWTTACHQCLESAPDCQFDVCAADPRCVAFDACIMDLECLATGDLNARIKCGQPCFTKVGILDFNDPSLVRYEPVNGCTSYPAGSCAAACVVK